MKYTRNKKNCNKLYRKERERYFNRPDVKKVTDNRQFLKTMKPFPSDKNITATRITIENKSNDVIANSNSVELPEEFANFFEKALQSLTIQSNEFFLNDITDKNDQVQTPIKIHVFFKQRFFPTQLQCCLTFA